MNEEDRTRRLSVLGDLLRLAMECEVLNPSTTSDLANAVMRSILATLPR